MASGTIKGTKTGSFGVEIDWVATPNSASANSSTVVSKVYITYYTINIGARTVTSSINGTSTTFTSAAVNDYPNVATRRLVATHTCTVNHDTNGTKTNVPISASFAFNLTSSVHGYIGTLSASGTVNFDTIPRRSTLSLSSTSVTTGSTINSTITKADSTFRHKLGFFINGTQMAMTDYFTGTTNSYTVPHSWLPSSNSEKIIVRLYTYTSTGTSALGTDDKEISANVLSTLTPTISMTTAIANGGLNGCYVQNKSAAKLTVSATASSGSTIKSYTFTGPNVNASTTADSLSVSSTATSYNLTTGVIKSPGTLTYQVTVYDARGRYATTDVSINAYSYAAPEITSALIQRCNSSGVLAKDGTYVKYTINSKFSPVLVGETINNWRTVTICHSSDDGKTYGSPTTLQDKTTTNTSVSGKYGSGAILTTNSYRFKIVITDQYGATDTEYVDLGSLERPMNVAKYGNGIAFGGFSSVTSSTAEGLFECNWDAKFTDDVNITGSMTSGSIISNGNTKTASLTVTGAETVGGNLTITGSTTSGSLVSNGNTKTATLTTTGNATIGGTMTIGGKTAAVVEQGTWTPTFNSGSAVVYSPYYTRVGKIVTVYANVVYTTGNSATMLQIGGLPFKASANAHGGGVIQWCKAYFYTSAEKTTPYTHVTPQVKAGTNYIVFNGWYGGRCWGDIPSNCMSNGDIVFSVTYQID